MLCYISYIYILYIHIYYIQRYVHMYIYIYCIYMFHHFHLEMPPESFSEAFPAVPGVGAPSIVDGRQQWGSDQVGETQAWELMGETTEVEVSETNKLMKLIPGNKLLLDFFVGWKCQLIHFAQME